MTWTPRGGIKVWVAERPIKHGTVAGYRAHYERGGKPCLECLDAYNAYRRARYVRTRTNAARCGTYAGARWHQSHGERLCDPCREARAAYWRSWRKARRAS